MSSVYTVVLQERFTVLLSVQGRAPVGGLRGALLSDEVGAWSSSLREALGITCLVSEHNTGPLCWMKEAVRKSNVPKMFQAWLLELGSWTSFGSFH